MPIDGYTEALGEATPATPNTLAFGTNAVLKIVLSGASATPPDSFNGVDGFDVESGPTPIRGLVINGFQESTNGNGVQAIGFFNVDGNTNNVVEVNGGRCDRQRPQQYRQHDRRGTARCTQPDRLRLEREHRSG